MSKPPACSPAQWARVKELVADALERPEGERAAFLAAAAPDDPLIQREAAELLAFAANDEDTSRPLQGALASLSEPSRLGQQIGNWRIQRELGRGGMGAVFLAERADHEFQKLAALKILKRGTDTDEVLHRFRTERQILARLDHPNIARLLDGGTTPDGLPYLVMEWVDGERITDWCQAHRLSVRERVALFLRVCDAVHFAHRNLVVHRDLKPGNLLVTREGEPKLLDFGIAKLLAPSDDPEGTLITADGFQRLTPAYASPEQVRGLPVTTASDIYSLGALLFELLTGLAPHRFATQQPSPTELLRVVAEEEAPRASAIATDPARQRALRGDLDNILRHALRKDPAERYADVTALAEDLRRHLEGRPVRARPATWGYRAGRFVRRNPLGVGAAALLFVTLAGGIAATLMQKRQAEERFNEVRQLARAVIFDYHDAIAPLPGSTPVREKLVKDALAYLDRLARSAGGDPGLRRELAAAYAKIARVQGNSYYANLGDTTGALRSARAALDLREGLLAEAPADAGNQAELASALVGKGDIEYTMGDLRGARASYERALGLRQQLPAGRAQVLALAEVHGRLSDLLGLEGYTNLGDTAGALQHLRRVLALVEPLALAPQPDTEAKDRLVEALLSSAMMARSVGNAPESLAVASRALSLAQSVAAALPNDQGARAVVQKAKGLMRYALVENGQLPEAIEITRAALLEDEQMAAADPKNAQFRLNLGVSCNALGADLLAAGDAAGALPLHRRALALAEETLAAEAKSEDAQSAVAFSLQRTGQALVALGQAAAAAELFQRAIALREPAVRADPTNLRAQEDVWTLQADLGNARSLTGDHAGAIAAFQAVVPTAEAHARQDPTHAIKRARLAQLQLDFGRAYRRAGDAAQAREQLLRAQAIWRDMRDRRALSPRWEKFAVETERELAQL